MTGLPSPSRDRLTRLFLQLAALPSPSGNERAVADMVASELAALGLSVVEDTAAEATGGETGNLYCLVPGETADPVIALGLHLDTVEPTTRIEPVFRDGVFTNSLPTILGADDKAAVAAILHAAELLVRGPEPFPSFEMFFSVAEEVGLVGAKHLAPGMLRSPMAAVFDSTGPVGGITTKAPTQHSLKAVFHGKAAHAGLEPERGRSAIQAAATAVAAMKLGRLDPETTANIGLIRGGVATNIVPDHCTVEGECRSHDEDRVARVAGDMVDALHAGAGQFGVDVDVTLAIEYRSFALGPRSPVLRLSKQAVQMIGRVPRILASGGGSDANVLNAHGLPTVNLSAGMEQVHTPDEYVALDELEKLTSLAVAMITLAPHHVG